jgi:hypothetical protein
MKVRFIKKKRSKFNVDQSKRGVKKRTIDGEIFDSQIEANYYEYLLSLQKQKIVKEIIPHPKFLLKKNLLKIIKHIYQYIILRIFKLHILMEK